VSLISESHFKTCTRFQFQNPKLFNHFEAVTHNYNLNQMTDDLMKLNQENCWAFSKDEMLFIKDYFNSINRQPTDVEIEIIAQSWSEHCKHKIFAADIQYNEKKLPPGYHQIGSKKIHSLFKTFIQGATEKIQKNRSLDWLISLFHDNAGIVRFDRNIDLCIKVETHNSPSALDPYGGALTGILGVNRDILGCGQGAKPIANTNVFCLAEDDYFKKRSLTYPQALKNPDRIAEGVHLGVQDGGNKSGIPTVNGAFYYAPEFVGKPLVFCGTIGVLPQIENNKATSEKRHKPGDYIVMSGGAIGKDGIHGATFSSMELNTTIPNSVVQIGDPLTQKRLGDFLIEARQLGLFSSVTDNGAGGLSSSIGEMAQHTNGAIVDLDKAPVKYPGLHPYELMISESQERMTFAVPPENIQKFMTLSKKRNVLSTVIGEFTDQGNLIVRYNQKTVAQLNLHFLHKSLPKLQLEAEFFKNEADCVYQTVKPNADLNEFLLQKLSSPLVRSHEHLVRRYDHEVKAATLVKPFTGEKNKGYHSPTDAGVIWLKPFGGEHHSAVVVGCGLNPELSKDDTYKMAIAATDEAVRNCICVGADPEKIVLVDNFCWPDPIYSEKNKDGVFKLGQLVRAAQALYDISATYGMPFVSGKDSMKNDYVGVNEKISVLPTVLVTAMGHISNLKHITTSEVKKTGSLVYLIGKNEYLKCSEYHKQLELYKILHKAIQNEYIESAHDVSDGGIACCLAEKMMSTSFGISGDVTEIDLWHEPQGCIIVTVKNDCKNEFEKMWKNNDVLFIGQVNSENRLNLMINGKLEISLHQQDLLRAYKIKSLVDENNNQVGL